MSIQIAPRKRRIPSAVVTAQSGDDTVKVRAKSSRRLVAMGGAQNSKEGLLGDVFRLVGVPEKTECGVPGGNLMSAHKLLEGGKIALSRF